MCLKRRINHPLVSETTTFQIRNTTRGAYHISIDTILTKITFSEENQQSHNVTTRERNTSRENKKSLSEILSAQHKQSTNDFRQHRSNNGYCYDGCIPSKAMTFSGMKVIFAKCNAAWRVEGQDRSMSAPMKDTEIIARAPKNEISGTPPGARRYRYLVLVHTSPRVTSNHHRSKHLLERQN